MNQINAFTRRWEGKKTLFYSFGKLKADINQGVKRFWSTDENKQKNKADRKYATAFNQSRHDICLDQWLHDIKLSDMENRWSYLPILKNVGHAVTTNKHIIVQGW